jgi:hypothetical protein
MAVTHSRTIFLPVVKTSLCQAPSAVDTAVVHEREGQHMLHRRKYILQVGATIRAAVTVLRVRGSHVTFQTTCWTDDQVAVDGEALATLRAKP